jgi:predicted short-subunit dehydrogenase-like oxidoreductase (DUF2520 family)
MKVEPNRLSIIGAGKVGQAIAILASRAGYETVTVGVLQPEQVPKETRKNLTDIPILHSVEAAREAELLLLTVPDDRIEACCLALSEAGVLQSGMTVGHCSGALGSEVLSPAAEMGCSIGSTHPLQTFPTVAAAVTTLPGTHWFTEGEPAAVERLNQLVSAMSGISVPLSTSQKALYHTAAVMACNYLTSLMDMALTAAGHADLDRDLMLKALLPLVRTTLTNIEQLGTAEALTGPIARGDVETVARHLQAMHPHAEELQEPYRALGAWTLRLAESGGSVSPEDVQRLRQVLCN